MGVPRPQYYFTTSLDFLVCTEHFMPRRFTLRVPADSDALLSRLGIKTEAQPRRAGRLGALRRSTFNWCRSAITSPSSALFLATGIYAKAGGITNRSASG